MLPRDGAEGVRLVLQTLDEEPVGVVAVGLLAVAEQAPVLVELQGRRLAVAGVDGHFLHFSFQVPQTAVVAEGKNHFSLEVAGKVDYLFQHLGFGCGGHRGEEQAQREAG